MAKKLSLVLILGLGLLLRLINIDQSFWLDEAAQAQMSSQSVHAIWFERGGDFHPPLFYLLAHFWLQIGRSEVWLRLLPVLFGLANIYVIYVFANKLASSKTGIVAAILLAASPYHIYYSQEFRSYSLLCLLGTLSMFFLYQKKFSWLALANILLFYTHYASTFLFVTQLVYVLIYLKKDLSRYIVSHLLLSILLLPWIPQFINQLNSGVSIDTYLPGWRQVLSISPLKVLPITVFKLIAGRITFVSRMLYGIYSVFVLAVSFFVLVIPSRNKHLLVTWIFLPILIMLFVSLFLPQSQPFRVIYILPAFILLIAQSINRFPKLVSTLIIYIFIVGNVSYFTRPRLQREQWRQAITFLSSKKAPIVVKFYDKFAPFY